MVITATSTTTRTVRLWTKIEMTARSEAKSTNPAYRDRAVPNRRYIQAAPKMDKQATSKPQPTNANPNWMASSPIGKGP